MGIQKIIKMFFVECAWKRRRPQKHRRRIYIKQNKYKKYWSKNCNKTEKEATEKNNKIWVCKWYQCSDGCAQMYECSKEPTDTAYEREKKQHVNAHLLNSINTRERWASSTSIQWTALGFIVHNHRMMLQFRFRTILYEHLEHHSALPFSAEWNRIKEERKYDSIVRTVCGTQHTAANHSYGIQRNVDRSLLTFIATHRKRITKSVTYL